MLDTDWLSGCDHVLIDMRRFLQLIHSRERFVPSGSALNKNVYALSDFSSREASIEKVTPFGDLK